MTTYEPHAGRIELSAGQMTAIKYEGDIYVRLIDVVATLRAWSDEAEPTSKNGATCLRAAATLIEMGK